MLKMDITNIWTKEPELKKEFVKNSLFLVIDPWHKQYDQEHPWVDEYNKMTMLKIKYYSKEIKHKATVTTEERHHLFHDWKNFTLEEKLVAYMTKAKLNRIVYAGFHHGACIIDHSLGCKKISQLYECYLKHDLVCLYPGDDWYKADERTLKYAKFI
jgi:hypothetical protein